MNYALQKAVAFLAAKLGDAAQDERGSIPEWLLLMILLVVFFIPSLQNIQTAITAGIGNVVTLIQSA